MHIFSIYQRTNYENDIAIVRSGISILPAILNIFWALYHSMWFCVIPIFLISFALQYYKMENFVVIFQIMEFLFFLMFSEELRKFSLKLNGYQLIDVIYAKSAESAEYKFLKRKIANA